MKNNNTKIIFTHIPKTAGTTIRDILENQYGSRNVSLIYSQKNIEQDLNTQLATGAKVIMGHFRYPDFINKTESIEFLTFLRNPVQRVISHYKYVASSKDPVHIQLIQQAESIEQFALLESQSNLQTKYLSGYTDEEFLKDSDSALVVAKENLKNYLIGITELFDESIVLFKEKLNWKKAYYVPINKSKDDKLIISKELEKSIANSNKLDIKLYEFALSRFKKAINDFEDFDTELSTYKKENKHLKNNYYVKYKLKNLRQKLAYKLGLKN